MFAWPPISLAGMPTCSVDPFVLIGVAFRVVVVDPARLRIAALPQLVQLLGGHTHAVAVAAGLANQEDGLETAGLQAAAGIDQELDEPIVGQRDRSRLRHVPADVLPAALRDVGDDGGEQRFSERPRNLVRRVLHDELVFAVHHVRAFLLGPGGADDDGRGAALNKVAHLRPCQLFQQHGIGWCAARRGGRGVRRTLCRAGRRQQQGQQQSQRRQNRKLFHNASLDRGGDFTGSRCDRTHER